MKQYAEMIKQSRKKLGLTQKELAKLVHTSQQAIARYETGRAEPSLDTLKSIADVLSIPVSYFVDKESSKSEEEYVALYQTLSAEDKKRVIAYMQLLKRQELERNQFFSDNL